LNEYYVVNPYSKVYHLLKSSEDSGITTLCGKFFPDQDAYYTSAPYMIPKHQNPCKKCHAISEKETKERMEIRGDDDSERVIQ